MNWDSDNLNNKYGYDYFQNIMKKNNNMIEYGISNAFKAYRVIIKLANMKEELYDVKKFFVKSTNKVIKNKNDKSLYIISDKKILSKIDNKKCYYCGDFSNIIDKILGYGYSVITMTVNGLGIYIEPKFRDRNLTLEQIQVSGDTSNIDCYLYNDDLHKAVDIFMNYASENLGKVNSLNAEELFNILKNRNFTSKKR